MGFRARPTAATGGDRSDYANFAVVKRDGGGGNPKNATDHAAVERSKLQNASRLRVSGSARPTAKPQAEVPDYGSVVATIWFNATSYETSAE